MPDIAPTYAKAIARYVRVSPQKARLVVDLIRGRKAEDALHLLHFTRKRIAADVAKLLQSAVANATDRGELDVDQLYIVRAFVNEGPRQKRIRPAPQGRAFHYQRRTAHIEIHVGERASAAHLTQRVEAPDATPAAPAPATRKPAARKKPAAAAKKKTAASRRPAPKSKTKAPAKPAPKSKPKGGSKNKGGE